MLYPNKIESKMIMWGYIISFLRFLGLINSELALMYDKGQPCFGIWWHCWRCLARNGLRSWVVAPPGSYKVEMISFSVGTSSLCSKGAKIDMFCDVPVCLREVLPYMGMVVSFVALIVELFLGLWLVNSVYAHLQYKQIKPVSNMIIKTTPIMPISQSVQS